MIAKPLSKIVSTTHDPTLGCLSEKDASAPFLFGFIWKC